MPKASGGGGRNGRISSQSSRGFKLGDFVKVSNARVGFEGRVVKINPQSIKLTNSWGQTSKPIKTTDLTGATVDRINRRGSSRRLTVG